MLVLLYLDYDSAAVELKITPKRLLLKPSKIEQVCKQVSERYLNQKMVS